MTPEEAALIPPRAALRERVIAFEKKNELKAYALLVTDLTLFVGLCAAAVVLPLAAKFLCVLALSVVITRLWLIGHDTGHGSFVRSRALNRWIGRIAFLPSLTPYRWWEVGHNMLHHGYCNLAGKASEAARERVWVPASVGEYRAMTPFQRAWYRFTRSVAGAGPYFLYSIWWTDFVRLRDREGKVIWDFVLVCAFAVIWPASVTLLAVSVSETVWVALLFAFVLPFLGAYYVMGWIVYMHHSHPQVAWYREQADWVAARPYITVTVHVVLPRWASVLLHHIMEHPVHHLYPGIPFYNLPEAQAQLAGTPGQVVQKFSWAYYVNCTRVCKLYDYDRRCWVGFEAAHTGGATDQECTP